MPAILLITPRVGCRSQYASGTVPRAKYSVYTIERRSIWPVLLITSTSWHPSVASLPDSRQTVAVVTSGGGTGHSGLSPRVATFMNRVHIGTSRSAANPFGRIVCGWSNPAHTPATSFGVEQKDHASLEPLRVPVSP